MTNNVAMTPYPRPRVPDLANWSTNPKLGVDAADWLHNPGETGAATHSRGTTMVFPGLEGTLVGFFEVDWTVNTSTVFGGIYTDNAMFPFNTAETVWHSVYVFTNTSKRLKLIIQYNDGSPSATETTGPEIVTTPGQWTQMHVGEVPPGTASGARLVIRGAAGAGGSNWFNGDQLAATCHALTIGTYAGYFDGDSAADGDYSYFWGGAPEQSVSYRQIPSPESVVKPWDILGWDSIRPTLNTVHQLLSGAIATVVHSGFTTRAGILKVLFDNAVDAWICDQLHATEVTWQYDDERTPQTRMRYVVAGEVHTYQDDSRKYWICEIPFREIFT